MPNNKIRVAISHGDINGISYEILLKVFSDESILELFTPVIYGSSRIANYWKSKLGIDTKPWNLIKSANNIVDGQVNIINCIDGECFVNIGTPTNESGSIALDSLERACNDVKEKLCDVLVTAPISKHVMPKDRFPFKGHTDYLQDKFNTDKSMMILTAGNVRVALATTHIPLKEVANVITTDIVFEKIVSLEKTLKEDFNIIKPRIAVLGLNPHCGDNGLIGKEEEDIIIPAIKLADEKGCIVFGPYAADGFFGSDTMYRFDGILAMYHDQGLAPFKALFMNNGVNFTSGIDIVRTSPDHGTGFDIAGMGVASVDSFRQSIYTAIDIFRARERYREITKNPLKRMYVSGNKDENINMDSFDNDAD